MHDAVIAGLMLAAGLSANAANGLDAARITIAKSCQLEGWQIGLTPNAEGLVRVELSPTISNDQILCVYQTLADYGVKLDRPSPVQVERHRVQRPGTVY